MDTASVVSSTQGLASSRLSQDRITEGNLVTWRPAETEPDFAEILDAAQERGGSTAPPSNRWASLSFLTSSSVPLLNWKDAQPAFSLVPPGSASGVGSTFIPFSKPMALTDFPRPQGDDGWGVHWIPTVSQSPEVVDRFVGEATAMGMKWVVFLNDGTNVGDNDYLVQQLVSAGIEPIMRVYTPGLIPISGDLEGMVDHYRQLGVNYFQLYNEPNLKVETNGKEPNVDRYLDLWVPAAKEVLKAGGLPGFGALSPQGEADDYTYLRTAFNHLKKRGQANLLDSAWVALHNYTGARTLDDPDGFLRFRRYDDIVRSEMGRSMPIISTEGGTHVTGQTSESEQIAAVSGAYDYMHHKSEAYYFANTYWVLANGHDPSWDNHVLIRADGPTALASALQTMASGVRT